MESVLQRALGDRYELLHPQIRRQYAITSEDQTACIGCGVMSRVRRGSFLFIPFLAIGAKRQCLFPERGVDVPFKIENYAYVDSYGRETITWTRSFDLNPPRQFNETMIFSEERNCAVVYAGSHQHLAVDLHADVDDTGSLCLETGHQRFYEWRMGFPFPQWLSGRATIRESYNDEFGRFEIRVEIRNRVMGVIFGYEGWFELDWVPTPQVPAYAVPVREELRH